MIDNYKSTAKKLFENKKYKDCLKICFEYLSINPSVFWIYDLSGFCYMNIGMFSQAEGCFNVCYNIKQEQNYIELIKLCKEKDNYAKKTFN